MKTNWQESELITSGGSTVTWHQGPGQTHHVLSPFSCLLLSAGMFNDYEI